MELSKFDLASVVDAAVDARRQREDGWWKARAADAPWRASSLGNCPRGLMLGRIGVPEGKDADPKTLRLFALGDLLGTWVVDQFEDRGILVAREVPYRDEKRGIAGHADAIVRWTDQGGSYIVGGRDLLGKSELVGVEVKTTNSTAMKFIAEEGPKREHKLQVGSYWLMAESTPMERAPRPEAWVITYVGKDYAGMLTFDADPGWKVDAANAVLMLNDAWQAQTLPVCTCTTQYGGTGPFYCQYLDREQDVKLVGAVGQGTSRSKKDLAPKVMCCARSQEGLEAVMRLWMEGTVDA